MLWPTRIGGPAGEALARLRALPAFRRAKVEARGRGRPGRLIVGIGQVHPVLQGKFEGFQARRIARVQAWIFRACLALREAFGVRVFGEEGLAGEEMEGPCRLSPELLEPVARGLAAAGEDVYLGGVAREWRSALGRDPERAAHAALLLSGLTLLQAAHEDCAVFAIEQAAVHGAVGEGVARLRSEMDALERLPEYAEFRRKGGKGLTREEYDVAGRHQALVKAYNATLAHPERDRAIFREIVEFAEKRDVTVFVLGAAHRKGFLRLARRHLPADVLFAWVMPPMLWWWKAALHRFAWGFVGGLLLLGAMGFFR